MVVTARSTPSPSCASTPVLPRPRKRLITPVPESPELAPRSISLPSLYAYLQEVPDPRKHRGRRHPLPALLALICLAWLSGIHGYLPAAEWARALPEADRTALGFTRPTAPAASTLFAVLGSLSWEALETQLRLWLGAVQEALGPDPEPGSPASAAADPQALAIDGKALRGSWKRGAEMAGLLA